MVTINGRLLLFTLAGVLPSLLRHPVHAARIELSAAATTGVVLATVRVYRDDFPPGERLAQASAYLGSGLFLTDARGARIPLQLDSMAREGDRLRLMLHGTAAAPLRRGRLGVTLLQEKFPDQVNVVAVRVAGESRQLIFLKGDAPQALP